MHMKKLSFIFALSALLFVKGNAQDRIMLIADPHVLPQTIITADPNFSTKNENEIKMFRLSESIWHALMDTAMAYRPSLVLIPGDLSRNGEPAALDTVAAGLARLENAGIRTLVIPGNHDLPDNVDWDSLFAGTYVNAVRDDASYSYAVSPLEGVTVIGIDATDGSAGTGVVRPATKDFILAQIDSATAKGNTIIAMCHWQILENFDKQGELEPACRLQDADAFRDTLMAHGVHVVLTGHFHVNGISTFRDTTGLTNDSIVEISTGSPITFPCSYRWLNISADRTTLEVKTDYITSLDTIADMYAFSRQWVEEHAVNLVPTLAVRAWNKVDAKWDTSIAPLLTQLGLGTWAASLKATLPSTNEERIDLTQRHMGAPIVNLYVFHSEANENERPELGEQLANAVYTGMKNLVDEMLSSNMMIKTVFGPIISPMAVAMAEEPVQSIVEDITQRVSAMHSDQTNDLHLTLKVNGENPHEDIDEIRATNKAVKTLHDGQILILRGDKTYTVQGTEIK